MSLKKLIDIPPVWLALALLALWLQTKLLGAFDLAPAVWLGRVIIALGLVLMGLAIWEFMKARTSPIPHTNPSAIITTGVFAWTRNPIYLGDALVLFGFGMAFGALSVVVLLPAFVVLIERRFILSEEARLEAAFPEPFAAYKSSVRRWF